MKLTAGGHRPARVRICLFVYISVKVQLLPSTIDENGRVSMRQHFSCFVVNDRVSIDAGCLAMAASARQRNQIRDVVLTHAHLDHIAGLPLFIDDLFASVTEPIRIFATSEVVEVLERDVFNWSVYPRFSELSNENGAVVEYRIFKVGEKFPVQDLNVEAVAVNHKVPTVGFIVSDANGAFALTGDTAQTVDFWRKINVEKNLKAILVECAFPNELADLAEVSHHLTPETLRRELAKCEHSDCPIYIINIKPMYREQVIRQIEQLKIKNLHILEIGKIYEW